MAYSSVLSEAEDLASLQPEPPLEENAADLMLASQSSLYELPVRLIKGAVLTPTSDSWVSA
jgi:hypothetical protein